MIPAAVSADEPARLAVLNALGVLDSTPEPLADALVRALAAVFHAPIAALTLVDAKRQWFKASVGLEVSETPRAVSFCAHAIHQDVPLVVPDAREDIRFHDNPLVLGSPHIRFYAGVPLRIDGQAIGVLCVIDQLPRDPDREHFERLSSLGIAVEAWLAARPRLRAPADHLVRALLGLTGRM